MRKKIITYLLVAVMAFSPATVFAGTFEDEAGVNADALSAQAAEDMDADVNTEVQNGETIDEEQTEESSEVIVDEEAAEDAVPEEETYETFGGDLQDDTSKARPLWFPVLHFGIR